MHFSSALSLLFVASALAAPKPPPPSFAGPKSAPPPSSTAPTGQSIAVRILKSVDTGLLQTVISISALSREAYGGDTSRYERDIEQQAGDLVRTMMAGSIELRKAPSIPIVGFTNSVLPVINDVDAHTKRVAQAYIEAKRYVVRTPGGREAVLRILNDHLAASGALGDALKSKVPAGPGLTVARITEHSAVELKRAISDYSRA